MEDSGGIDKFFKHFRRSSKEKPDSFRNEAKEQVLLFSNSENQEPLATYEARPSAVFDMAQHKPGTILRVKGSGKTTFYSWYVIGKPKDAASTQLYEVTHRDDDEDLSVAMNSTLRLRTTWDLKDRTSPNELDIENALKVITGGAAPKNYVEKIDVMTGGIAQKEPETRTSGVVKLQPQQA